MSTGYNTLMTHNSDFCPVIETAKLVGDTATLLIIKSLLEGEKRYKDIKSYVNVVTDATLSNRLKFLCQQDLITRTQHHTIPPKVTYRLTQKGLQLKPVIKSLEVFGTNNLQTKT